MGPSSVGVELTNDCCIDACMKEGSAKHQKKNTVLNLILRMEKIVSILKNVHFSGKGRQSLIHVYKYENS